jgi:hypothetical protein
MRREGGEEKAGVKNEKLTQILNYPADVVKRIMS